MRRNYRLLLVCAGCIGPALGTYSAFPLRESAWYQKVLDVMIGAVIGTIVEALIVGFLFIVFATFAWAIGSEDKPSTFTELPRDKP
jgi:hypothetical protein